MRNAILIVLLITVSISVNAQNNDPAFIESMQTAFNKRNLSINKICTKTITSSIKANTLEHFATNAVNYFFIPELSLKRRPKSLYKTIDSTNLIKYVDARSVNLGWAIAYNQNGVIGTIERPKPNRTKGFVVKTQTKMKLYDFFIRHNPIFVFSIQNQSPYFAIKNQTIYVVLWDDDRQVFYLDDIDKYVMENRENIFCIFGYSKNKVVLTY